MRAVSCDGVALQHFRMLSDSLYKATITVGSVDLHENECSDVKIEFLCIQDSIVIRYKPFFFQFSHPFGNGGNREMNNFGDRVPLGTAVFLQMIRILISVSSNWYVIARFA